MVGRQGEIQQHKDAEARIKRVAKYLTSFRIGLQAFSGPAPKKQHRAARHAALLAWKRQRALHEPERPHRPQWQLGYIRRAVCRRTATSVAAGNAFRRQECSGPRLGLVVPGVSLAAQEASRPDQPLQPEHARGHLLCTVAAYTFCLKCGAYTSKLVRGLAARCPGRHAARAGGAMLPGRHPVSREELHAAVRPLSTLAEAELGNLRAAARVPRRARCRGGALAA